MIKSLPAIEEKFDMEEVDKATPNWLKWIMLVFVALLLLGTLLMDKAMACSECGFGKYVREGNAYTTVASEDVVVVDIERLKVRQEMIEMWNAIDKLRERTMDLIIEECKEEFSPEDKTALFYFCTMVTMYDMQRTLRHAESIIEDFIYESRPDKDIAEDFDKFNSLMNKYNAPSEYFGTFGWYHIRHEYEAYLEYIENVRKTNDN